MAKFGSYQHWQLQQDDAGIVWLRLDTADRSVNILHQHVLAELDEVTQCLAETKTMAMAMTGLVLMSGKPNGFCYGADIGEFATFVDETAVAAHLTQVHSTFQRLAGLPIPSVALVDGIAVGGGLELALTCDALFASASPKTQLGFPEISLGLMPGFGGSGRAYRRVGVAAVLDLMLSGKSVSGSEAAQLGLVDGLADDGDVLRATARTWLGRHNGNKPNLRAVRKITPNTMKTVFADATAKHIVQPHARPDQTPAPFAIIDHVKNHIADADAMSVAEQSLFPVLMMSQASRGLRRRFSLGDQLRKLGRGSQPISHVHVIGTGVMGGDIAAYTALLGLTTSISDSNDTALDATSKRAAALFGKRLADAKQRKAASDRLLLDKDAKHIRQADVIIEAVAEDLAVKQQVLRHAETQAKADAVLASNTSSIPLQELAAGLKNPSRLIGLHFFNPAAVMPLVEVIAHQGTHGKSSDDAIERGLGFCRQVKKMPLLCQSTPGFMVNRALLPYINAAIAQHCAGTPCDKLDQAMCDFGMPMGPIELADPIGLDVLLAASLPLTPPMASEVKLALERHIAGGRLGRKSGEGFYAWQGKRAVRKHARYPSQCLSRLAEVLLQPMLDACRAAVADGVVADADMADAALMFAAGFPGFRGGPLFWADNKAS